MVKRPVTLTDELWASIERIFERTLAHPFVGGLADGTLPEGTFRYYIVQDTLFLREYARAHSLAAARAESADDMRRFDRIAFELVESEQALHDEFFSAWDLSERDVWETPLAPTNLAYTSFMLAVAHGGTFAEAVAALLPCAWIYLEVGRRLAERGSPVDLYQRWIDLYAGEEYAEGLRDVLAVANRLGSDLGRRERERVERHFVTAARYEWMFWEMAYRRETWPV